MEYRWTGEEKLTLPLAYLNCQLSFESRVPTNGTPTHLDIAVSVDRRVFRSLPVPITHSRRLN